MWSMFVDSLKLFARGKLFRDPRDVFKQWAIGVSVALLLLVALATKAGLPLGLAVAIAAFGSGALMPWLFKDLKYR